MYEQNRIRFVPWEKYTAKDTELEKSLDAAHLFSFDSSGRLKMEQKKDETDRRYEFRDPSSTCPPASWPELGSE